MKTLKRVGLVLIILLMMVACVPMGGYYRPYSGGGYGGYGGYNGYGGAVYSSPIIVSPYFGGGHFGGYGGHFGGFGGHHGGFGGHHR